MKENGFINEFKKFIMRGNVMDMAVGVIVGGVFTAIVTSLNYSNPRSMRKKRQGKRQQPPLKNKKSA